MDLFSGTATDDVVFNSNVYFINGKLKQKNPANDASYVITPSAISGDKTLYLPLITATDTLAVLNLAQTLSNKTLDATCTISSALPAALAYTNVANTFTEAQKITKDTDTLFTFYKPNNSGGYNSNQLDFNAKSSTNAEYTSTRFKTSQIDATNGSQDTGIELSAMEAGALETVFYYEDDKLYFLNNQYLTFAETGLTAARTFTFPNTTSVLPGVVSKSGALVDINTTAAETDLLNYSVLGNSMGANGFIKFKISGYILQNQVTGTTYTFKVKFGGTTMYSGVSNSIAQSAVKQPFRIEGELYNENATNAQGLSATIILNDTAATTTGIGDIGDDEGVINAGFSSEGADTTKDTTTDQTFQVTVTMSVSNAATHTVVKHKYVQLST